MKRPAPPSTNTSGHETAPDAQLETGWFTRLLARSFGYQRYAPVPADLADRITVLGIPNARFWADSQGEALAHEVQQALEREKAAAGKTESSAGDLPPANFVAISGGSDDGSFGAGLICGWSDAGTMPTFKLVTGISTGSMIAPFAFLGRSYMDGLRSVYTKIGPDDVLKKRGVHHAVFGEALADTAPLYGLITHHINEQALADISTEYNKGRLLLIGTASLDAQRPVIWNIGAIAASGDPGALELIRKILRASSAVPGIFEPVMIDVTLNGKKYQELHVDGGAIAQMFLYPPSIELSRFGTREREAYLIRNNREDPDWANVQRRTLSVSGRAISVMLKASGANDLTRIYFVTQRDGVDYNLAYIESDFRTPHPDKDFDKAYMSALFDYAYQKARNGYPWRKSPPLLAGLEQQPQAARSP